MPRYKKALCDAFKPHFKDHGFTKKDATWHLGSPEAIHVFNIQTSQWSESYMFNVGIYLRTLGPLETPPEYHCHIRTRIPDRRFHDIDLAHFVALADFKDTESGSDEKILELKNMIYPLVFDWFSRFRDMDCIRKELIDLPRPWFMIAKEVWPLIGLEPKK
jgi:hypothetical protein